MKHMNPIPNLGNSAELLDYPTETRRRFFKARAQHFFQTIVSLKKFFSPSAGNKIQLHQLPWFLIIGSAKSGKSTLLENSQISFLAKQNIAETSIDEINTYGPCNWRATSEWVLLDVPSGYLTSNETTPRWQNLFLKKRNRNNLAGVIVTLPLTELTHYDERVQFIANLKFRMHDLQTKFGSTLPFYFAVTKCDLIPGFLDFFAHSGSDELGQAWGITMPPSGTQNTIIDVFSNRFDALIKRLNKQLIWRLHQERGTFERVFIKDFPLQVERLKENLIEILAALSSQQNTFNLQGVYLTSANQHPPEDNIIQHPPQDGSFSKQEMQIMNTPAMPSRSYFIRQFLLQGLHAAPAPTIKIWQKRTVVYGLCAGVVTLTLFFLGYDVFYSKQKLIAMRGAEVSTFNIIVPPEVPRETRVSDQLTIVN